MIWLLLAAFLSACAATTPWAVTHLDACDPEFRCSKLTYKENQLDLTFHTSAEQLSLYLNLHTFPAIPAPDNAEKCIVTLKINDEEISFFAERRRGGQRLDIPEEITLQLIDALLEEKRVKILLCGYETQIDSKGFAKALHALKHAPLIDPLKKIQVF
jgi:hypothetical protein